MLKLSEKQMAVLSRLLSVNDKKFTLKPVLVAASGCNSCNGSCQGSCGGCSQGCGSSSTCAVTIKIF